MPKLSVLVPVYNEKDTLLEIIRQVQNVPLDKEIIVVDDASTDGTRELIRRELENREKNLKVIYHDENQGKGSAIRTALRQASGEIVIIQDADLEYDPRDFISICGAFDDFRVKVVYGSRFKSLSMGKYLHRWFSNRFQGGRHVLKEPHFFFGIKLLNGLANLLYGAGITDEATCYKAFKREVLDGIPLRCRGFDFCPEVTAKVRKHGFKIAEVPVSYAPRSKAQGKKLNWSHGFEAIGALIKYRFTN
ncbi:MAG: glycosyltransferase family 2 protein [Candidatus Omnitrophota bacterium]